MTVPPSFGDSHYIVALQSRRPGASLDRSWFFKVFEYQFKRVRDAQFVKGNDGDDR